MFWFSPIFNSWSNTEKYLKKIEEAVISIVSLALKPNPINPNMTIY
jgi:hypothetical protein